MSATSGSTRSRLRLPRDGEIEIYGIPTDTTILAAPRWVNMAPYTTISASSATGYGRPSQAADGVLDQSSGWVPESGISAWI